MAIFHTFTEVNKALVDLFPPPTSMREAYSLDRMYALMNLLGNPQNQLKVVHVAGTSGKTSTCYYTSALLQAAGQKVGLTVSPHIDEVNERVQINLEPLKQATFSSYFTEFIGIPGLVALQPTYFEALVAFAFWVFVKENVDYAVIEVGLGGLGDATNVIDRADKVCVITDIGFDHMQVLGDTIEKITRQKAGIIQQHNVVVTPAQDKVIQGIITETAQTKHATLTVVTPEDISFLQDLPPFGRRNWQVAQAAYEVVAARDDLPALTPEQLAAASYTVVPARMEVVKVGNKTVVLDGSHNQQKLKALRMGLKERFGDQKMALLTGFVQTRHDRVTEAIAEIAPVTEAIIITSYQTRQDFQHTSLDTQVIKEACQAAGAQDITIIEDVQEAFRALLERPEPILVVTGSFYLLGHIRPIIKDLLKES